MMQQIAASKRRAYIDKTAANFFTSTFKKKSEIGKQINKKKERKENKKCQQSIKQRATAGSGFHRSNAADC